jgi:hypothetical protein
LFYHTTTTALRQSKQAVTEARIANANKSSFM